MWNPVGARANMEQLVAKLGYRHTVTTNDADPASAQIPNTSHSNEISPLSPPRANNDPPPFFILGDCLKKI